MSRFQTLCVSGPTGVVKIVKNTTQRVNVQAWSARIFLRAVARALAGIPLMLLRIALDVISISAAILLSFLIGYGITLVAIGLLN